MITPLLQDALNNSLGSTDTSSIMAELAIMMIVFIIIILAFLVIYVYASLTLYKVSKRLKVEPAWLAWIPIGNIYLKSKIVKMPWWPIISVVSLFLGMIILIIGTFVNDNITTIIGWVFYGVSILVITVFNTIWDYKICQMRNRPGWWVLLLYSFLVFVPLVWVKYGIIVYYAATFISSIWYYVVWGILAWSKK